MNDIILLILFLSLMISLLIFGILIRKFCFFDKNSKLPFSLSRVIGNVMIFIGSLMGGASFLVFLLTYLN